MIHPPRGHTYVSSAVKPAVPLQTLILARIPDYLSPLKKFGFWLTKGRNIARARELARSGLPVRINVWLDKTDFRDGSISM